MIAPPVTLSRHCFIYGGMSQCMWHRWLPRVCSLKQFLVIILNSDSPLRCFLQRFSLIRVSRCPPLLSSLKINNKTVPGLSLIYLGQTQEGMTELEDASRQQSTEEHSVIDEAIRDRGEGYTVFSIVRFKGYLVHPEKLIVFVACWCPLPTFRKQAQKCQDP